MSENCGNQSTMSDSRLFEEKRLEIIGRKKTTSGAKTPKNTTPVSIDLQQE